MATALQRPLKGSRISTFYPIKSVPALSTLDSAFQLQEFISLTIRSNIHDVAAIITVPDSRGNAEGGPDDSSATLTEDTDGDKDAKSEFAVDEACWIYEQLRYAQLPSLVSRRNLSQVHKTARAGPFSPLNHDVATGMHACFVPRDESWRMDVLMRRSRQRRRNGSTSLLFSSNEKKRKASLMIVAAMLRHRLHSTHRRQRNSPSELATSVPITVRVTIAPSLFFRLV